MVSWLLVTAMSVASVTPSRVLVPVTASEAPPVAVTVPFLMLPPPARFQLPVAWWLRVRAGVGQCAGEVDGAPRADVIANRRRRETTAKRPRATGHIHSAGVGPRTAEGERSAGGGGDGLVVDPVGAAEAQNAARAADQHSVGVAQKIADCHVAAAGGFDGAGVGHTTQAGSHGNGFSRHVGVDGSLIDQEFFAVVGQALNDRTSRSAAVDRDVRTNRQREA